MIPRVETKRLLLREWRPDDFETYAHWQADEDVVRFIGGQTLGRADAWRGMASAAGHWVLRGYGVWAVEAKENGALVGRVGLLYPEGWPGLEVGWTLGREHWGKGYASEAAQAALDYAFSTQTLEKVISLIHEKNIASQKVAVRIGETRGAPIAFDHGSRRIEADMWSITREEWAKRKRA